MTAKRSSTRLVFSLVLVAGVASWAMGQVRQVRPTPVWYRIWTPKLYGLNRYHYLGPIAPYAPGSFSLDGWYDGCYPPLFETPRHNPALPGSVPAPWPYGASDWYYRRPYAPYVDPPPFYGGYYSPNTYQLYYGYSSGHPWNGPFWHWYRGIRDGRSSPEAPTEVPRSR